MENEKKYCLQYDDNGDLNMIGIVHGKRGTTFLIEYIDCLTLMYLTTIGQAPSTDPDDIIIEQFYEVEEKELENPKFFYTWKAVVGEIARNKHIWNK